MEYMSLKEAAARWNMPGKRVASLCEEGRIAYAVWDAGDWRIPATANCPGAAEPVSGRARPFMKWAGGKGQLLEQIGRLIRGGRRGALFTGSRRAHVLGAHRPFGGAQQYQCDSQ